MGDECFIRARYFLAKLVQIDLPMAGFTRQGCIKMTLRAMGMGHAVSPLGAGRNLEAFDGIEHKQSQFPVKNVEIHHIVEPRSRAKLVAGMVSFKRQPVRAQAVVVEVT